MKTRVLAALLLVVLSSACARRKTVAGHSLPVGDAVWFEEGIGATENDVETRLAKGGFASVFLPAKTFSRDADKWVASELPPPPSPFSRLPVSLVIRGGSSVEAGFAASQRLPAMTDALWLTVKAALKDGGRFGRVQGVHLDFPFSAETAEAYSAVVSGIRSKLSTSLVLSVSLRFSPSGEGKEKLQSLCAAADGFLAFVFGVGNRADAVSADLLERPWWAGYAPGARGRWTDARGEDHGPLPERFLASLTDDLRVEFTQDLALREESESSYQLKLHQALSFGGTSFAAGDRLSFRMPALADMIYRLGADLAGRRFVRGRVVLLAGQTDSDRIFTLAAMNDVLLGRSLKPQLLVTTERGEGFVQISAENVSTHASVLSRTSNWVEVDIPSGGIRDVQSGGFDRFEVFGADGRAVTLGRATRVRFYETLIGPFERIDPARIILHAGAPPGCCASRFHLLAAAGEEISGEGTIPEPTPKPTVKRRR